MSLIASLTAAILLLHAAADEDVNIIVPAYFYPSVRPQDWAALNSAATALPNRVVAIANPDSGPSTVRLEEFADAITSLQSAGGRAIGYVYTRYSNRTLDVVKADVDLWYSFYPSLDGIFLDEAAYTDGSQSYYVALYDYVKSKNSSSLLVTNPGTSTLPTYLFYNGSRVADVICVFEGPGSAALSWTTDPWTASYSRSNFCALAYNTSDVDVEDFDYGDVIDVAYQQNVGWVYVTDDNLPNPWDTIATYFSDEVAYIQQYNYLPSEKERRLS